MRPLQEPPTTSEQENSKRTKLTKKQQATMQWHDNISSYKCFETIATPSPIPIAKQQSIGNNVIVVRSTSLDSLANSEIQEENSSQSSCCGTDCDSDELSDCDSINEQQRQQQQHKSNANDECSLIDSDWIDPTKSDYEKPIITELVKKASNSIKQCENKNCTYRQFSECHLISDCTPIFDNNSTSDSKPVVISIKEPLESGTSKEQPASVPFHLNGNGGCNQKARRTSITSSGSVGRMETIIESPIEEPIEPKISVKEILQRFETLTSLEVFSFLLILFFIFSFLL